MKKINSTDGSEYLLNAAQYAIIAKADLKMFLDPVMGRLYVTSQDPIIPGILRGVL